MIKKYLLNIGNLFKKGDRNHNQIRGKETSQIWIPDIAIIERIKKKYFM